MDIGELFNKIKLFFIGIYDYFKNFKRSSLYKFADMMYALILLIVTIVKSFGQ